MKKNLEDLRFDYIGIGLVLAGGISNQAEVALLGHATDYLFLRTSESTRSFVVANFADVMVLVGIFLLVIWAPLYRRFKEYEREEARGDNALHH